MPSYPDYINAIAGKTFSAQFLYIAVTNSEAAPFQSNGMTQHEGTATSFTQATN